MALSLAPHLPFSDSERAEPTTCKNKKAKCLFALLIIHAATAAGVDVDVDVGDVEIATNVKVESRSTLRSMTRQREKTGEREKG